MEPWTQDDTGGSALDAAAGLAADARAALDGASPAGAGDVAAPSAADVARTATDAGAPSPSSDASLDTLTDDPASTWDSISAYAAETWDSGVEIWTNGGWAMIPLALISLFIFYVGFGVWQRLGRLGVGGLDTPTWRRWIHEPDAREGAVGKMFNHVDKVVAKGNATIHDGFDEIRIAEVEPFERDLKLMQVAVGAAPLVGLLGTVTGMLTTFSALGQGGGGDQTMAAIAGGISEALYTTETGLVVALPGLFFHYFLSRRFERFRNFLAHAEAAWSKESLEVGLERGARVNKERLRTLVHMELKRRVMARIAPNRA